MVTINSNADYLKQKLEWVEQRMQALDEIEYRLRKMRELAEYARDNNIGSAEAQKINDKLWAMREEIRVITGATTGRSFQRVLRFLSYKVSCRKFLC